MNKPNGRWTMEPKEKPLAYKIPGSELCYHAECFHKGLKIHIAYHDLVGLDKKRCARCGIKFVETDLLKLAYDGKVVAL